MIHEISREYFTSDETFTKITNTIYAYLVQGSTFLNWSNQFLNLSRYSQLNEKTYSRNFRRYFNFVQFNSSLIETVYHPQNEYLLALDASFIPKSGKATYGLGTFWNGVQNRPNRRLEVSSLTLVYVTYKTTYTSTAGQVPICIKLRITLGKTPGLLL